MNENELPVEAHEGPIFHPDWGTHSYAGFDANITGLNALLAMVFPLLAETARSERYLEARRLKVENDFSGPWKIDVNHTMLSWQVVMRVSAVEAYLQDALTHLALYDPEFIRSRGSKQEWDYEAVRSAADNRAAVWTFCNRWARAFIADGGPVRWSKALSKAGIGEYDAGDVDSLEEMWGFRHLTVHNYGRFSADFIARHRALAERLRDGGLTLADVQRWTKVAERFVDSAERGISGRLRARLGSDLVEQRQQAEFERQTSALRERHQHMQRRETPEDTALRVEQHITAAEARFAVMDELFHAEPSAHAASSSEQDAL